MSQLALDLGVPSTLVTSAVFARCLSALKEARLRAAEVLRGPWSTVGTDSETLTWEAPLDESLAVATDDAKKQGFIDAVREALYASKICSYAQGYVQMREAAKEYDWDLNYGQIALLWRGGCIIRAQFLERIKEAFDADPQLENLLLAPDFTDAVHASQDSWRRVVMRAIQMGLPVPAFTTALSYFDGYRRKRLPANLLQAQRDYFGAHTYQRTDEEGTFHTDWLGKRRPPAE